MVRDESLWESRYALGRAAADVAIVLDATFRRLGGDHRLGPLNPILQGPRLE